MKKIFLSLVLLIALATKAWAQDLPETAQGYLSDFAGILSEAERGRIEQRLVNLEQQTGAEVAVVTVTDLQGVSIEEYAVKLFEKWQIGKRGQDNGLLLLVAVADRAVRIEVGYGLEPVVTDAESSWMIRDRLTPAFREGKYGEGIESALDRMEQLITKEIEPRTDQPSAGGGGGIGIGTIFAIFFGLQFLYGILAGTRSWWLGGVLGGIAGLILGLIFGFFFVGIIALSLLIPVGLIIDYVLSKKGLSVGPGRHTSPWMWGGTGRSGWGGGKSGFGGFGGGRSGGGGASGRW